MAEIDRGSNATGKVALSFHTVSLAASILVLVFTFITGIVGNLLVCWVVYRIKSLQTANNALLVNLAIIDLLKCSLDIPLLLLTVAVSRADLGETVCTVQQFSYSLSSCVQLLTLVIISAERFQAIAFPFEIEQRTVRIKRWIFMIWVVGFLVPIMSITFAKHTPIYLTCRHQAINVQDYFDPFGVCILVPIWIVSLALIVLHYMRIFFVVKRHANKIFDSGILPPSAPVDPGRPFHKAFRAIPLSCPSQPEAPGPHCAAAIVVAEIEEETSQGNPFSVSISSPSIPPEMPLIPSPPDIPEIIGAVCLFSVKSREHARKRLEEKIAKRFGYIFVTFLAFWVPLVVILFLTFLLKKDSFMNALLLELQTFAVALTCVPAAVNPFIYAIVNRQFNSEFQKLASRLISPCKGRLRGT
ncbi:G-protein coupled receptor 84-like [Ambystoma mexicanum]|uniref:G-protein coupled receptor 84-like n=1 Tax=Ambystoma mexicanum TaxID=8296 RepID=UPI0037E7B844